MYYTKRIAALFIAIVVVGAMALPSPGRAITYQFDISGNAVPFNFSLGAPGTINVAVQNTGADITGYILDLEIYTTDGTPVFQDFHLDMTPLLSGQTANHSFLWSEDTAGAYIVKAGVFSSDWSVLFSWNDTMIPVFYVGHIPDGAVMFREAGVMAVGPVILISSFFGADIAPSRHAIIDLELYRRGDPDEKVRQIWFDDVSFADILAHNYPWEIQINDLPPGEYVLKAGIFTLGWKELISWNDQALVFALTADGEIVSN